MNSQRENRSKTQLAARSHGTCATQTHEAAFTLVEMLVVIAIIGILAGLTLSVLTRSRTAAAIKNVEAQLRQIESGIASYHASLNFYPPDNTNASAIPYDASNRHFRGVTNQLYYELMGTVLVNGEFETVNKAEKISPANIQRFFQAEGIANSSAEAADAKQPFLVLKPNQFAEISSTPDVEVLIAPGDWKGPDTEAPVPGKKMNPWRYDSSSTNRHNPNSYDLWAEFYSGNKRVIRGNWKE